MTNSKWEQSYRLHSYNENAYDCKRHVSNQVNPIQFQTSQFMSNNFKGDEFSTNIVNGNKIVFYSLSFYVIVLLDECLGCIINQPTEMVAFFNKCSE